MHKIKELYLMRNKRRSKHTRTYSRYRIHTHIHNLRDPINLTYIDSSRDSTLHCVWSQRRGATSLPQLRSGGDGHLLILPTRLLHIIGATRIHVRHYTAWRARRRRLFMSASRASCLWMIGQNVTVGSLDGAIGADCRCVYMNEPLIF
jgi:hypothetical protein